MILLDANLLIYARSAESPHNALAREWLDSQLSGNTRVGIPWHSLLAFVRIITNPRVLNAPESMEEAWEQVEAWLACPNVWCPVPGAQHASILRGLLLNAPSVHANLVSDAHLAALAIEHGLQLCSTDGDFARFPKLRWLNPLV